MVSLYVLPRLKGSKRLFAFAIIACMSIDGLLILFFTNLDKATF